MVSYDFGNKHLLIWKLSLLLLAVFFATAIYKKLSGCIPVIQEKASSVWRLEIDFRFLAAVLTKQPVNLFKWENILCAPGLEYVKSSNVIMSVLIQPYLTAT